MIADRGMDNEAQIVEIIQDMTSCVTRSKTFIKAITNPVHHLTKATMTRKSTPKWIGNKSSAGGASQDQKQIIGRRCRSRHRSETTATALLYEKVRE